MTVQKRVTGEGAEAPPDAPRDREAIRREIREGAAFCGTFILMNALAAVVASYGLLMDSAAVVIGAMIIAMLLGPITAIALALVEGDRLLLRTALLTEVGGAVLVFAIALGIGWIHRALPLKAEIMARTAPNLMDLIVALAGGAAGAYAMITPRISANLVGVAVATALVPPLATCGICLARGATQLGFGGFVLYITNLTAIQVASSVVLGLGGFRRSLQPEENGLAMLKRHGLSLALLMALIVALGINFGQSVAQERLESSVRDQLKRALQPYADAQLAGVRFEPAGDRTAVYARVYNTGSFSPDEVAAIESRIRPPDGARIDLHLQTVLIKETTRQGYRHVSPETAVE